MFRKVFAALCVVVTLGLLTVLTVDARRSHHSHHGRGHHRVVTLDQVLDTLELTDEQRAEIDTTVDALVLAEATKEEVRVAVVAHLDGFGVAVPLVLQSKLARQVAVLDLTDDQRAEIDALIAADEAAGTAADVTREAVVALLEGFGVEVPVYLLGHVDRLLLNLDITEEQVAQIKEAVDALVAGDATKAEIRAAVIAELEAMGVETPENLHAHRHGHRGGFHFFLFDLTDDQRVEILTVVTEMQVAGASHDEVHEAVKVLLVEWEIIEGAAEAEEADAAADLAIIDGQIQAAPSAVPVMNHKLSSWGAIKAAR